MTTGQPDEQEIGALICLAKTDREAMGRLLEMVRPYLLGISNAELAPDLRAKIAASDVVQDSLLEVVSDFPRFVGTTAAEFRSWARTMLLHNLANWERWYRRTDKRALGREQSMEAADSDGPTVALLAAGSSPSHRAMKDEKVEALHRSMAELPSHYRQVLELRHWQSLSFEEIGNLTQRTPDAVRMLWWRAVDRLQEQMSGFK